MVLPLIKMGEGKLSPVIEAAPAVKGTWKSVRSNLPTVLTILGIVLGIAFGCVLRSCKEEKWSQREQAYLNFGGEIFLRMLKALSLPLILSSVIAAVGSLDLRLSGKIGMRTFFFYLLTTVCAVLLGVILVVTIHPGGHSKDDKLEQPGQWTPRKVLNADVMMDMIRNMFPSNLIHATMYQYQTILDVPSLAEIQEKVEQNETLDETAYPTKATNFEGTNFLGLLVFSTVFGAALARLGTFGKPILKFVRCFSQVMMIISNWILWLAPFGIFFLVAGKIVQSGDLSENLSKTGMYLFTVLFGLSLHGFVLLPIVFFLFTGSHPLKLIGNVAQALATAFGTGSSIATLPATVSCVEEKHGVDPRVARFVLPIGAAINMDGTALWGSVAGIFLLQLHGIALSIETILAVSFVITISSIGASGIPHAGVTILTMLMNVMGLPADCIIYLIPVDWILDRFRTTVNVLGDTLCAAAVDQICKDDLDQVPIKLIDPSDIKPLKEEV